MGWCRGSYMAEELWCSIKKYIAKENMKTVANIIYKKFDDNDADCWEDAPKLIKDAGIKWE